jgi:alcohol dehydrogenase
MRFNIIYNPNKFANIARLLGVKTDELTTMEAVRKSADEAEKLILENLY